MILRFSWFPRLDSKILTTSLNPPFSKTTTKTLKTTYPDLRGAAGTGWTGQGSRDCQKPASSVKRWGWIIFVHNFKDSYSDGGSLVNLTWLIHPFDPPCSLASCGWSREMKGATLSPWWCVNCQSQSSAFRKCMRMNQSA